MGKEGNKDDGDKMPWKSIFRRVPKWQDLWFYQKSRHLSVWTPADDRFQPMQDFTKSHNVLEDYEPYFQQWSSEEMANVALTLCFQIDTMMNKYMMSLEKLFVTEGGIKERMYQARTGYRQQQDKYLAELEQTVPVLQQQLKDLQSEVMSVEGQVRGS